MMRLAPISGKHSRPCLTRQKRVKLELVPSMIAADTIRGACTGGLAGPKKAREVRLARIPASSKDTALANPNKSAMDAKDTKSITEEEKRERNMIWQYLEGHPAGKVHGRRRAPLASACCLKKPPHDLEGS